VGIVGFSKNRGIEGILVIGKVKGILVG